MDFLTNIALDTNELAVLWGRYSTRQFVVIRQMLHQTKMQDHDKCHFLKDEILTEYLKENVKLNIAWEYCLIILYLLCADLFRQPLENQQRALRICSCKFVCRMCRQLVVGNIL